MVKETKTKETNDWRYAKFVDLYHECMEQKHDVRLVSAGWSSSVMYCLSCRKVWKLALTAGCRLSVSDEKGIRSPVLLDKIKELKKDN